MKKTNYFILTLLLLFSSCSDESIKCDEDSSLFKFDVDFSTVLDHSSTNKTTHIKIYYEDYFDVGNMKAFKMFDLNEDFKFKTEVCLPINNHPLDSIVVGLRLIQENKEINDQPTIYFQVPLEKNAANEICKKASSLDFWDSPPCESAPVVFQNLEDYKEGVTQLFNIAVAGGFGVHLQGHGDWTPSEIAAHCEDLMEYSLSGVCPCSKCYVRFD